ncbi:hypothetical protein THRCLA_01588 [Thraustotheca clavata]|uniref:Secreted protein n=1 Tax=Thraustotheca clavata TaxID=74557 RepID=A0A0A7CLA9_9STRA|nr:secreted protein [Thraustotheca clavata]OQS06373.1 hypothetical protein THRCLA_01588 [Thraustotheca clavata]
MKLLAFVVFAVLSVVNAGTIQYLNGLEGVIEGRQLDAAPVGNLSASAPANLLDNPASFGSIALDLQSIAQNGVTAANNASLLLHVQNAIDIGLIIVKDGPVLISSIINIINNASPSNGIAVVNAIQTLILDVATLIDPDPKVCRRQGVGRGVGQIAVAQCLHNEEEYGGLCYPKCKEGYEAVGCCICRKIGCSGVRGAVDIGVSCTKPPAYGRGVGYVAWQQSQCEAENPQGCEMYGAMWYPKCSANFHSVGCCICSPDCPAGTIDDGAFCRKDSYGRGVGVIRLGCPAGLELSGLLCYPPCAADQVGVGPVCWSRCYNPTGVECGLFCTSTVATCVGSTVEIIGDAAKISLSLVALDFTGALNTLVQVGGKYISMEKCKGSVCDE